MSAENRMKLDERLPKIAADYGLEGLTYGSFQIQIGASVWWLLDSICVEVHTQMRVTHVRLLT